MIQTVDFKKQITAQLTPYAPYYSGDELASIIVIKGIAGKAEFDGLAPFSGQDGLALDKSLGRLGWGYGSADTRIWFGILLKSPSLRGLSFQELKLVCEIVDPLVIVALDDSARLALIEAYLSAEDRLPLLFKPGANTTVLGRRFVSVDGFEGALQNMEKKQMVWSQLKNAKVPL